jgi:3',5'-cyclic AMP phosphodiesterase CpdA
MIIVHISDTHIDPEDRNAQARFRDLEKCVRDINSLDSRPDVVIHTGDLAHNGTPEKYAEAVRILSNLHCPLQIAAGNRDDRNALNSAFPHSCELLSNSPYMQYSVEAYPLRLIAIDTLSGTSNQGGFCQERAHNLQNMLAENPSKPTAIFMHHPPFEVRQSDYPWQFDSRKEIEILEQALAGHSQVVRGFCGHSHREAEGTIAGVLVSSVPSVAIDLRLGDFEGAASKAPLYQIHRFDPVSGFFTETRAAL